MWALVPGLMLEACERQGIRGAQEEKEGVRRAGNEKEIERAQEAHEEP